MGGCIYHRADMRLPVNARAQLNIGIEYSQTLLTSFRNAVFIFADQFVRRGLPTDTTPASQTETDVNNRGGQYSYKLTTKMPYMYICTHHTHIILLF